MVNFMALRLKLIIFVLIAFVIINNLSKIDSLESLERYPKSSIVTSIQTIHGDVYDCVDIFKQPGLNHPTMATKRIRKVIAKELEMKKKARLESKEQSSSMAKLYNNSKENYSFSPGDLWLNKKGCPLGSVPIRQLTKQQLLNIQKLENSSYFNTQSFLDFAGLIVGNSPSGRMIGAKTKMTIWNPSLKGDHQYSSSSLYVENGDNQIRVGWIVYPALWGDSRTRLFSRWTSDNYGHTGCYINHCPGFVVLSNDVPLDYPFPNISEFEGEQFDATFEVVKGKAGDWVFKFNEVHTIGMWTKSIFSKMSESATQLRFGGETLKPNGEDESPEMGSGRMVNAQYDKTCYMRQISYVDPVYGENVLDDSMVQGHDSRCYYEAGHGFNSGDSWNAYNFFFGGAGGKDEVTCVY